MSSLPDSSPLINTDFPMWANCPDVGVLMDQPPSKRRKSSRELDCKSFQPPAVGISDTNGHSGTSQRAARGRGLGNPSRRRNLESALAPAAKRRHVESPARKC